MTEGGPARSTRLPRASGVLLHPSSLPGEHGSGDCGDAAYRFVDWLVQAGQTLWQVLPLGPVGAGNSPYTSPSAFAGNELLIDLVELQRQGWLEASELAPAPDLAAQRVDFAAVRPFRMQRLALAEQRFAALPAADPRREQFDAFCTAQRRWLDDYSLFMALHEAHGQRDWCEWDSGLVARDAAALAQARRHHAARVAFWKFCQWNFYRQWALLKRYANDRGVRIVGDVPIFIAYQSAEVWASQRLFELGSDGRAEVVAGVPPDFFSSTGQRWGNPLYRWSEHARDGYAWWVQRMAHTLELVDVVRIDHFRGFAGYWEIPAGEATAVNGRWRDGPGAPLFEAMQARLGAVAIIAEDLGLITPDVEALRRRFGFPGMRILQFAFGGDARNPYLPHRHESDSVVYPGTHDNNTCNGWWSEAADGERVHASEYLQISGDDIAWRLIRTACASVADTAVYAMQDLLSLGTEARMNRPGQDSGCWEWRMQWSQLQPWHASHLAELCRLFGRDGRTAP